MREKKFRGFDDIHCPQSWKEQVMDQAESSERKKASIYVISLCQVDTQNN